jgi:large subunit ribosomal protein L17
MFRNQLTALFTHDRIITTLAKAKELRPLAERMVTLARNDTVAARRRVATMVQDKDVARRLFDEIAPRFADRPGGYTRIMRLGRRRGDNAELAIIEFVDYVLAEHVETGDGGGSKGSFLDRAKGVFGGGAAATAADTAADDDATETSAQAADEPEQEAVEVEADAADEPDDEPVGAESVDDEPKVEADDVADEPEVKADQADEPQAAGDEADEEKKDG